MQPPTFSAQAMTPALLRRTLQEVGACLLTDFPCGDLPLLERTVQSWGQPVYEERNIAGGMVFEVTVDQTAEMPAYASTPYAFDCHTDCAEFAEVPDAVLLLCEQAAAQGGESLWAPVDALLPYLSSESLLQLQKPQFPFKSQWRPVLDLGDTGEIEVRYQPLAFLLSEQLGVWQKSQAQAIALAEFAHALQQTVQCFSLKPGDCFVLHNRRSLHGRLAFQGQRLLKRVRFYLKA